MKHFLMCLLYIAALGVLSFVVGRLIPKHWFHADRFPWVCHPAEQKLWKRLHVRKWQAKIPDMSRIFVKIMPEKKLTKENYENLPRMIEETCVAEWTHILLSIAGLGLLKIWSGVGGVCITIIYIVLGNLPFIVVQRYLYSCIPSLGVDRNAPTAPMLTACNEPHFYRLYLRSLHSGFCAGLVFHSVHFAVR